MSTGPVAEQDKQDKVTRKLIQWTYVVTGACNRVIAIEEVGRRKYRLLFAHEIDGRIDCWSHNGTLYETIAEARVEEAAHVSDALEQAEQADKAWRVH